MQERPDNNIEAANKIDGKLQTHDQYATRLFHTIQTGSYIKKENAQKQFNSLQLSLDERNLDFLRIEKVGKYHTVRLGKFENYETAKRFLEKIPPRLSESIILKANIK